jgi:ATP phosphoribosyltransferase regulatory subunit
MPNWLLPENIADALPAEAKKIEDLRRRLLDHFRSYGYELVMPPMLEYLESLLCNTAQDLDLRTFKLVDQLSGRTLGIRADITTQVARIDAHLLNRATVARLCYAGSVLHARPSDVYATREPLQIGAEIYGHAGLEADIELQELLLTSLSTAGICQIRLDLCHVGVLRALLDQDEKAKREEFALYTLLEAKDISGLKDISLSFNADTRNALLALPGLYGDATVLDEARQILPHLPGIDTALNDLASLIQALPSNEHIDIGVDLADLRGLHYHSGVTFAAYVQGFPNAVARGGRYDHVGAFFGRARPATGFSLDLRELVRVMPASKPDRAISAPWSEDAILRAQIADLRQHGEVVIQQLPGQTDELGEFDCDRALVFEHGKWTVKERKH